MKRIFDHFYGIIGRMTPSQIIMVVFIVVAVVVGTAMILGWAKSQYYGVLYSNLSGQEAGKIVERLDEMGVAYEITDGGKAINVPSGDINRVRMKLATEGLPNPRNIGYALFDQNNIGMTDFLQKVNYKRAVEGELAQTISSLSEISAARVHLVMPEDRLFVEDQNPPSASIMIKLQGTTGLSKRQIKGMTYLVASSVEGMSPDNVTIVDDGGNLLTTQFASDELAMLSSSQFELRKNVEGYLERKAQSLLATVVGNGHSIVRVTVDLDFEQNNTQVESYDPDGIAVRSEQRTVQRGSEQEAAPGQQQTTTAQDNLEDVITNYEVSRTVRNIIGDVGSVKKLTVATIIDGTYENKTTPEGDEVQEYFPRSPEELTDLASIIKNAVGFDEARGDHFEIVNMPFDNPMMKTRDELESMGKWNTYIFYGKKIGYVLLLAVAFLYVKKKLKTVFSAIAKYVPPPPPPPPPLPPAEPELATQPQQPKLVDSMKSQAEGRPEEIAKVIKTMMAE